MNLIIIINFNVKNIYIKIIVPRNPHPDYLFKIMWPALLGHVT